MYFFVPQLDAEIANSGVAMDTVFPDTGDAIISQTVEITLTRSIAPPVIFFFTFISVDGLEGIDCVVCTDPSSIRPTTTTEDPAIRCRGDEFTCAVSRQCVPMTSRCDGFNDCIDRSDEINC